MESENERATMESDKWAEQQSSRDSSTEIFFFAVS